ncbi:MAG: HDOD domain-containing protein [Desulfobacterota bacterium]|nr:HDOD domain-containing protein [Thermodesulfobacteriota bacterium]
MNIQYLKNIILDKVNAIPTVPHIIRRLIPMLHDENTPLHEVEQIISMDIAISTRLLKVANSAYYGFMKQVTTVRQALSVLGMRQVKSLALGISVLESMKQLSGRQTLDYRDLWLHSIGCAMAATLLCDVCNIPVKDTAFTAAILHDMGKIPLNGLFPDDYAQVIVLRDQNRSLADAESEIFGIDHGDVAGWLCDLWKFPTLLTDPIRNHHKTLSLADSPSVMTGIVCLADYLSRAADIGCGGNNHDTAIPYPVCALLHLNPERLSELRNRLTTKKQQATSFVDATL